jgi:hypothetical protein
MITEAEETEPYCSKAERRSASEALNERFPT